ncbi:hypothetical protein H4582DRAFT_2112234 [Lactarius indigo]|nr:hypothetical protein H4582DRAFT_2112234 [Lactarius indigo]
MQQYHLRPVSELSRSPSSRSSRSPPDHDMSPPSSHLPPIQHSVNGAQDPPKPLDLDVSNGQAMPPRIYPPPPTGHELMRLFPPQPPEQPLFLKQGSTSLYFRRQEHQFFAQAGKEIIRVRVESDFPPTPARTSKGKEPVSVPHPWSAHPHAPLPPSVQQQQQQQQQQQPQPQQQSAQSQPQPTMQPPPPLPEVAHAPAAHMHSPPHPVPPYSHHHPDIARGNPSAVVPPPGYAPPHHPATIVRNAPPPVDQRVDDIREEDDQSWRRPTPHGERRRAGKHTRRVVVRT